jgi:HlyD family secretion protein
MASELFTALKSLQIDRASRRRAPWGRWFGAGVVAIASASAALLIGKPYIQARLITPIVSTTTITSVSPQQEAIEFSASGYARTDAMSNVAPKVAGAVTEVFVKRGDRVNPGDRLYTLDVTRQKARILDANNEATAASAAAAGAEARVSVTQSQLQEMIAQEVRAKRLVTEGIDPAAKAEEITNKVTSLRREVEAVQAEAVAEAKRASTLAGRTQILAAELNDLVIISPIAGTVLGRPPQLGEHVDPQFGPTLLIGDLSQQMVDVDVPEGKLDLIALGDPAEITLDAYADRRFRGEIRDVLPTVDRAKATVTVRVAFLDEKRGVLPDMAARVSFLKHATAAVTLGAPPKNVVPSSAIATRAGARFIFVVETDRVRMLSAKLGGNMGTAVELLDGPPAGTVIVNTPSSTLMDGQPVRIEQ